ncbi:MAG: hypothetical protein EAZ21_10950 [Betaproteobacteria bacterium]|nr:MAG: hypothetical protein EAZ21_10950 [Betaproteobacteria bacterium]
MLIRWKRACTYLIAAIWLPLSMVSHAHMTAMLVQNMGGANHPALPAAHEVETPANWVSADFYVVVDAALFWDAVDQYTDDCKWSASCTTIATAVTVPARHWQPRALSESPPISSGGLHRSLSLKPATPPPRDSL